VRLQRIVPLLLIFAFIVSVECCRTDPYPVSPDSGYSMEVAQIFESKCATGGCHNDRGAAGCGGLNLSSWENLFKGSDRNAVIIPFRPDQSYLLFSVNAYPDLGPHLHPGMPLNAPSLSREDVLLIRDWIARGAPSKTGVIPFSQEPRRSKIYVANQGCDFVTVFDARTKLAMRAVDVGNRFSIESPHDLHVAPDGNNWYVTFFMGTTLQKYSAETDQRVGELDLGIYGWHSMAISADSRYAALSKWDAQGRVALVDLENMSLITMMTGFAYPHGCAFNADGTQLYVVSQMGNFFYKLDITDPLNPQVEQITLHTNDIPSNGGVDKPYVIRFAPDGESYFITCQGTNEVRIFSADNDSLIGVLPTTGVPQLIEFSESTPYAFVTCMLDTANASTESSVDILNWHTNTMVSTVYPGFQERGLAVDDANGVVYVGNRNVDPGGPAPHHTTSCGGRNGDISLIDLHTLQVIPGWRAEVGVDPYCLDIRK
jgi:DNA-binding beta-propeller fold protein YncE